MRNDDERALILEFIPTDVFKERNRPHVEVVRRFVEEHQLRCKREGEGKCCALSFAARSKLRIAIGIEFKAGKIFVKLCVKPPLLFFIRNAFDIAAGNKAFPECRRFREDGFLFDIVNNESVLPLNLSVIEPLLAGEHRKKRAFSGSVAADQTDAFARFDRECCLVKKWQIAVGEVSVRKRDECHEERMKWVEDERAGSLTCRPSDAGCIEACPAFCPKESASELRRSWHFARGDCFA